MYTIAQGALPLNPVHNIVYTTAAEGCLSTANLDFLDSTTNAYILDNDGIITMGSPNFVNSFDQTTGALVINTSDVSKYAIKSTYKLKITITLPESTAANNKVEYYFELIIQHKCANNQLSLTSDLGP